jgi:hypothetical protein
MVMYNDIRSVLLEDFSIKKKKFIEMFKEYVNNDNLNVLYYTIENNKVPSDDLIKNIVNDSQTNQKLFQLIEVLFTL